MNGEDMIIKLAELGMEVTRLQAENKHLKNENEFLRSLVKDKVNDGQSSIRKGT